MFCGSRLSTAPDYSPNDQTADLVNRSQLAAVASIADDFDEPLDDFKDYM